MTDRDVNGKKAAEGKAAGAAPTEKPRLSIAELDSLYTGIASDVQEIIAETNAAAVRVKERIAIKAARLAEMGLFPAVSVVDGDGQESTAELLEIPGSGRKSNVPLEIPTHKFTVVVSYVTPKGDMINLHTTPKGADGKRTIFAPPLDPQYNNAPYETLPIDVLNFARSAMNAIGETFYKGLTNPANHRQ